MRFIQDWTTIEIRRYVVNDAWYVLVHFPKYDKGNGFKLLRFTNRDYLKLNERRDYNMHK